MRRICLLLPMVLFALVVALSPVSAQPKQAAKTIKAVRFGKLWDAKGKLWTNAIVIVEGDRIRTVTSDRAAIPSGAEMIDLSPYTGLPGLIDVHTHMTMYTDETPGEPMLKQLTANPPAVEVFLARKGALRTLEAGVTTVRDLGSDQYMDIAMRDLINRAEMVGPRMFVCGYGLYITNTPYKPGLNPPAGGIADGVPEVLRVVRQQIAAGADVIKMYASTGTDDDVTGFQTYNYEEIKAAVDTAHQFGKRIAIHSYGPDGARDAQFDHGLRLLQAADAAGQPTAPALRQNPAIPALKSQAEAGRQPALVSLDAVRIAPQTPRAVRNDGEAEAAFLLLSVRVEDHRAESTHHEDFWPPV